MHVSTLVRWGATVGLVGLAVTACSDAPTVPQARRMSAPSDSAGSLWEYWVKAKGRGRPNQSDGVFSQDIVVDPTEPTMLVAGEHKVYVPANSICDPATSGYGEDTWDLPCTPLQDKITIHVEWSSRYGHASISFEPNLRFVPSSDENQWVHITMKDYYDLDPSYSYPIFWQRPSDGLWIDESLNDPTMGSIKDLPGGRISRRLKHFSTYWVGAGEICDVDLFDSRGASCLPVESLAGYMVGG